MTECQCAERMSWHKSQHRIWLHMSSSRVVIIKLYKWLFDFFFFFFLNGNRLWNCNNSQDELWHKNVHISQIFHAFLNESFDKWNISIVWFLQTFILTFLSFSHPLSHTLTALKYTHAHTQSVWSLDEMFAWKHSSGLYDGMCSWLSLHDCPSAQKERESSPDITNPPLMYIEVSAYPQNYPPFCPQPPCKLC